GPQIRGAAAAGRLALLELASAHFRVSTNQLNTKGGTIAVLGSPGQTITYGELVNGKRLDMEIGATGQRFDMKVAPGVRPKDPSTYTVIGQSIPRKDIPAKMT